MSTSLEKKVDKILEYLGIMSAHNESRFEAIDKRFESMDKRFDAIDKRFDAIEEDLTILKATTRRLEARQGIMESYLQAISQTQHEHQKHLTELTIRIERLETWRESLQ